MLPGARTRKRCVECGRGVHLWWLPLDARQLGGAVACERRCAPAAVAPGGEGMLLVPDVGCRIKAVRAPWVASAYARERQPASAPGAVEVDGLQRVLRAGRQMPAFQPEPRLERPSV